MRRESVHGLHQRLSVSRIACLAISFYVLRKLMPQDGKPPSAWTSTDGRSTFVAISLMVLMLIGVGLLVRGVTG